MALVLPSAIVSLAASMTSPACKGCVASLASVRSVVPTVMFSELVPVVALVSLRTPPSSTLCAPTALI